ncbi:hypothetical protein [Thiomicrospira sp.]|uniref:hypothetical protein n=1 Tax=Thiomicrospira sp. TaxID=935 RepID=UPI002F91D8A8
MSIKNELIIAPMVGLYNYNINSILPLKLVRLMNHKIITQIIEEKKLTIPIRITKSEFSKVHDEMNEQECRALKRATNGLIEKSIRKAKGNGVKKEIKICEHATFQEGKCSALLQPTIEYINALIYSFTPQSDQDRI